MPVERSAGIILFRNTPEKRRYLVLRSDRHGEDRPEFWDFPKGVLAKGETGIEAAEREIREETGVKDLKILPEFKVTVQYFTRREGKSIPKFVAMFLGQTKEKEVKLSWEHDKYEWLPYPEAYSRISIPQMKKALEKGEEFLSSKSHE